MITSDQHPSVQLANSCAQNFSTEISNIRRLVYVATGCSHLSSKRRKKRGKRKTKEKSKRERVKGRGEVDSPKFSHCLRARKSFVAIPWKITIDSSSYFASCSHPPSSFICNELLTLISSHLGSPFWIKKIPGTG